MITAQVRQAIHEAITKGTGIETGLTQTAANAPILADSTQTITGTKTFSGTNTFSGAISLTGTVSSTASITPTGGVAAAGGYGVSPRLCHTGNEPAIATTSGTNAASNSANTIYLAELYVPCNMSATGVAVFNGTAVAGNGKALLYATDTAGTTGTRVALSASTAMSGTTAYQLIPFTGGPIAIKGPATYFIGMIYDDTTHDLRGHTIGSFATGTFATSVVYATDSTMVTVTTPTTFGGTTGPIASLY